VKCWVSEAPSLRVPKVFGQRTLVLVRKLSLLNLELRLQRENDYLYVPLVREPLASELEELKNNLPEIEISKREFQGSPRQPTRPVDLLSDRLSPHVLASLPHAIDFVGDIAVVEIAPELESYKRIIGEAILTVHKTVRTVLAKSGAVGGVYRLRTFEVIGGETKINTVHKEHGCVFHVDLAKAYFSPRLSYEHSRIASSIRKGETVVDMFAGVGSFSILIAREHEDVHVYAIDVNPDAFEILKKNVLANRVEARVKPVFGDARQIVNERLTGVADRVIMNLPERAIEYVDVACRALKPEGGVIHYYEFSNKPEPLETAKSRLKEAVTHTNRRLEKILLARIVRGIAPFTYQIVVDAEIR